MQTIINKMLCGFSLVDESHVLRGNNKSLTTLYTLHLTYMTVDDAGAVSH